MIHVGIDDTDTPDTEGTNQLARRLAAALPAGLTVSRIVRHQLLFDPRIPFTSHNGSASLRVEGPAARAAELAEVLRTTMRAWFQEGSDPGLCVATDVPADVIEFGRRCQSAIQTQKGARALAAANGIRLEGLGGTEDGVIGALAAVGLGASGDDGRVVHLQGWTWPDPFAGVQPVEAILARGVAEIREHGSARAVTVGEVDIGKHLRPNVRHGRIVLYVQPTDLRAACAWTAAKLP